MKDVFCHRRSIPHFVAITPRSTKLPHDIRKACQRLKSDPERQANCHEKVAQAIFYEDKQQAREATYQSMQEFWQDGARKEEQK